MTAIAYAISGLEPSLKEPRNDACVRIRHPQHAVIWVIAEEHPDINVTIRTLEGGAEFILG